VRVEYSKHFNSKLSILSMLTVPSTPVHTPARKPTGRLTFDVCNAPNTPPITPIQTTFPTVDIPSLLYECDQTGNDHKENQLQFSQLVDLSIELARILRRVESDYSDVSLRRTTDIAVAVRLLQRDTTRYHKDICMGTGQCAPCEEVKRNAILRALTLFSLGGFHATQYLEHDASRRIAWIIQLNESGVWIKHQWERTITKHVLDQIREGYTDIQRICDPALVHSVVFNSYFLMLFARFTCIDLSEEMDLMGVQAYSWHDLSFLRKAYFKQKEKDEDICV
jgi:hypothetical protein